MIKAVIFDIDNTLYSYDDGHAAAFPALCAYAERELGLERETFTRFHKEAMETAQSRLGQECAALHNRLLRYQILLESAGKPLYPHCLAMNDLYWSTLIDAALPSAGAPACLKALKEAGYILGIGTDMTLDYQLQKLTKLKLLPMIDFVVSSEEVLAEKPDPKLFRLCAEKAGARPEECLFVGDNLKKDVLGAQNAGMEALWYAPAPELRAKHPEVPALQHFDQLTARLVK